MVTMCIFPAVTNVQKNCQVVSFFFAVLRVTGLHDLPLKKIMQLDDFFCHTHLLQKKNLRTTTRTTSWFGWPNYRMSCVVLHGACLLHILITNMPYYALPW